ncbi:MAG: hypothetical protein IGS54_26005 [Elainella sp. C42_A2020_010]|nr:hypothetical protein [Elainella sp. C42_A2020_010]
MLTMILWGIPFSILPLAQVRGGIGIIQDSTEKLEAVQEAWNERWTDIFDGANGLYLGITEFAAVIVAGAFIFFAVIWIKNAIERGILPALPEVLWVFVVMVLLFNNGALLGSTTLGIRNLINAQTRIVLDIQIGEVSMIEALNDVILSQQAKSEIQQEYAECEAKEGQAQIDCFVDAGESAREKLETEFRAKGWWTAGVERQWARIGEITEQIQQEYENNPSRSLATNPVTDVLAAYLLQTGSQALAEQLLKGWQWAFTNLLELSMLITGLLGPIAVAGSVIPMQSRPIWAWLIGFFSLGMAKFSYNVIVGLAATVVVAADAQDGGDFSFLLLISILAPILALALASGAGMAVFRGISGGITRIIAVGTSFIPIPK